MLLVFVVDDVDGKGCCIVVSLMVLQGCIIIIFCCLNWCCIWLAKVCSWMNVGNGELKSGNLVVGCCGGCCGELNRSESWECSRALLRCCCSISLSSRKVDEGEDKGFILDSSCAGELYVGGLVGCC